MGIGIWDRDWGLGIGILDRDWILGLGLGIGIKIGDWAWHLEIGDLGLEIGDLGFGNLGLGTKIRIENFGIVICYGDIADGIWDWD